MIEPSDSLLGTWILDQYRLLKRIGTGATAQVYLAAQPSMDRYAAVKILRPSRKASDGDQNRFRLEARAISRLAHPHIVTVYNFGELADGILFLAMEHVEGRSLRSLLADGALPVLRAVNLTYQCADALACAHSKQIVHRDIKPENVMVARLMGRDHVKVLDFGIARVLEEVSLTESGTIVGTPEYVSPEHCRGESATSFSDQYSLGLIFHEMLTGRRAVSSDTAFGCLHCHTSVALQPPSTLRPEAAFLDPIVMRMVAKSPEERFSCMEELQRALDLAINTRLAAGKQERATVAPCALAASPAISTGADTARVLFLGNDNVVTETGREGLQRLGLQVARCSQVADWALQESDPPPDLWVLGVSSPDRVKAVWSEWTRAGIRPERTLLCVAAPLESAALVGLGDCATNVLIGPHPLDPLALAIVLRRMHSSRSDAIDPAVSQRAVQMLQIADSTAKSYYVDTVTQDLEAQGVRLVVRQAVRELSEEMIMNALFHAPPVPAGERPHRSSDPAIASPAGRESTLRWLIGERFIAVSIRDTFGTLTAQDVFGHATGPAAEPKRSQDGGAGLGLRMMSRAAQHLFFFVSPGHSSEVLALVEKEPQAGSGAHTLCVLECCGVEERRIGDRLYLGKATREDGVCLSLRGTIDETSDLSALFLHSGTVRLDLSRVAGINSRGIQAWLEAARKRSSDLHLVLERCSLAMVRQFSMVAGLAAPDSIVSFFAPYFCTRCSRESLELLVVQEMMGMDSKSPPPRRCAACGQDLQFEEMPESYFSFMARR